MNRATTRFGLREREIIQKVQIRTSFSFMLAQSRTENRSAFLVRHRGERSRGFGTTNEILQKEITTSTADVAEYTHFQGGVNAK